jgi:hypothetical protein
MFTFVKALEHYMGDGDEGDEAADEAADDNCVWEVDKPASEETGKTWDAPRFNRNVEGCF